VEPPNRPRIRGVCTVPMGNSGRDDQSAACVNLPRWLVVEFEPTDPAGAHNGDILLGAMSS